MKIDKQYTFFGVLYIFFWTVIALFLIGATSDGFLLEQSSLASEALHGTLNVLGLLAFWYFCIGYVIKREIVGKRKTQITSYATAHHLSQFPTGGQTRSNPFQSIAVSGLKSVTNYRSTNHIYTKEWVYGDVLYDVRRQVKNGDFKAFTIYYAAMITKLPRKLPNVFFDSKKSRGRQFRFHFAGSQRHSLEGNFDKYFATYFPDHYTIDSMSFISPDVMQALIDASDYDIEIKNDTLCIFGSPRDPQQQIPEMKRLLAAIRKQLMDNILTYRDERVSFEKGRQVVSPIAVSLKKSKFWFYVGLLSAVIYAVVYILVYVYG